MSPKSDCLFCSLPADNYLDQSTYFFVKQDKYPVTIGHLLIIPKRHISSFFDLTAEEFIDYKNLLMTHKNQLEHSDPKISGFNIGVNIGKSAGQTIMHCHIHLIPRRSGDCTDPTGGVRGVIPKKQKYAFRS